MKNHSETQSLPDIDPVVAKSMLETLAEHALDSIMITSAESNRDFHPIVFVNRAFTEMTGYAASEVLGKTPAVLHGPKTSRSLLQQLSLNLAEGKPFHGETVNYRKDGSEFAIEWRVIPVSDTNGEPTYHLAIQRDAG